MLEAIKVLVLEPRPREIHARPCAPCPTLRSPDDEESVNIRDRATRTEQVGSDQRVLDPARRAAA